MRITPLFAPLVAFVLSPAVHGIEVDWYGAHSCHDTPEEVYKNVACNSCVNPPGDFYAVKFSGLGKNNRVTIHNQGDCSSESQVGQWFGNTCGVAPGTNTLHSAWVACRGDAADANATYVSETSRATFTADD